MPKATKVGKFRASSKASSRDVKGAPLTSDASTSTAAKPATRGDDVQFPSEKGENVLSRGQKKRLAKREQYLNKERMVLSSLRLQRLDEQKGKIDGLDALRDALSEACYKTKLPANSTYDGSNGNKSKNVLLNTNKAKKTLGNDEITHMGFVLQHPSFVSNPFAAIQQHLRNSLASDAEKLKEKSLLRKEEDIRLEAKKKEEKKERVKEAKFNKSRKRNFKSNQR